MAGTSAQSGRTTPRYSGPHFPHFQQTRARLSCSSSTWHGLARLPEIELDGQFGLAQRKLASVLGSAEHVLSRAEHVPVNADSSSGPHAGLISKVIALAINARENFQSSLTATSVLRCFRPHRALHAELARGLFVQEGGCSAKSSAIR